MPLTLPGLASQREAEINTSAGGSCSSGWRGRRAGEGPTSPGMVGGVGVQAVLQRK